MAGVAIGRLAGHLFGVAIACASAAAHAQLGASVIAASDYRVRGISMSDDRPVLGLSINYDGRDDGYAGLAATAALSGNPSYAQLVAYAGHVFDANGAPRKEIGITATHFAGHADYDFAEAYAGLLWDRWTLRAYVAPDYFGRGVRAEYLEATGSVPLTPRWRLFGRGGALFAQAKPSFPDSGKVRWDGRFGVGWSDERIDLQLSRVAAGRRGPYLAAYPNRRGSFVFSASVSF
ncbi:MAG: TorF family putative porin [Caldimonas sp.]